MSNRLSGDYGLITVTTGRTMLLTHRELLDKNAKYLKKCKLCNSSVLMGDKNRPLLISIIHLLCYNRYPNPSSVRTHIVVFKWSQDLIVSVFFLLFFISNLFIRTIYTTFFHIPIVCKDRKGRISSSCNEYIQSFDFRQNLMEVGQWRKAHWCVKWSRPTAHGVLFEIYMFFILFVVPITVMIITYSRVSCEIWNGAAIRAELSGRK